MRLSRLESMFKEAQPQRHSAQHASERQRSARVSSDDCARRRQRQRPRPQQIFTAPMPQPPAIKPVTLTPAQRAWARPEPQTHRNAAWAAVAVAAALGGFILGGLAAVKRGASKSPRRGKKGDMIINPGATREQIMVDMAVVAFDRTALEMDRKWGIDRLVDLVTPDMAIKYGQALARMNEAISDGSDPTLAQRRANDCVRGVQAMDRVATESGAQRASEAYWEVMVDDIKLGIMADSASWQNIQDQRPDLTLVSLREVALAYRHYSKTALDAMVEAKKHFPGAEVSDVRAKSIDDPIPF